MEQWAHGGQSPPLSRRPTKTRPPEKVWSGLGSNHTFHPRGASHIRPYRNGNRTRYLSEAEKDKETGWHGGSLQFQVASWPEAPPRLTMRWAPPRPTSSAVGSTSAQTVSGTWRPGRSSGRSRRSSSQTGTTFGWTGPSSGPGSGRLWQRSTSTGMDLMIWWWEHRCSQSERMLVHLLLLQRKFITVEPNILFLGRFSTLDASTSIKAL